MKHKIIYSHGFGVLKDDRGLFTDIAEALPGTEHILFDYNTYDLSDNSITIAPINSQVEKLKEIYNTHRDESAVIDIIAHSQGCLVAAMAKIPGVRRVIYLAPPTSTMSAEKSRERFSSRPNTHIDVNGISRISRRDGSTTLIPAEYWESVNGVDPMKFYNAYAEQVLTTVVWATEDEVLRDLNYEALSPKIKLERIKADHNFQGESRAEMIDLIKRLIK